MADIAIDKNALNLLRGAVAVTRFALIDALFRLEDATKAFAEAKRKFEPTSTEYIAADEAQRQAAAALNATRENETNAYNTLQQGLSTWLFDQSHETDITVEEDVPRLDQNFPIVMFPVRIETRFEGPKLKVRVFPDEIYLNMHETALTVEEHDAAIKYYEDLRQLGNEKDRWREIIQRFGPERSAYLLRVMRPTAGLTGTTDPAFACGEQLQGATGADLTFPGSDVVKLRAGAWTRPGEAVLPDRWVVVTYRNGVRRVTLGRAIPEPLPMTVDPGHPETQQVPISTNGYKIDDKIKWTVDFARAKQIGMGIELDLDPSEAAIGTGGFDRVIVFGVKTSFDADVTAQSLERLFDAHHYTRGLAFVRQGTPTNNTADSPTPFPPEDEDGEHSFEVERNHAPVPSQPSTVCIAPDKDGGRFADALGLPTRVFANIDRAREEEISNATAMTAAMWPLTYGYFMKVLMGPREANGVPIFTDNDILLGRAYATAFVRSRGQAPAFRVGGVPYGLLPAISIYNWRPNADDIEALDGVSGKIVSFLQRLIPIWLDSSVAVPRVTGNATDPDVELMRILSTYPSTKEVRVREGLGRVIVYNICNWFGINSTHIEQAINDATEALFRRVGHPEWRPRIGGVFFDPRAWRLAFPLVSDKPLEQVKDSTRDFILGIRNASVDQLNNSSFTGAPATFNFLYTLLRHATLNEYARVADGLAAAAQKWKEPEVNGFPSQTASPTIVQEALALLASAIANELKGQFTSLEQLAKASEAELDRLTAETLDLASHRLDAWVTGVASQRLAAIRARQRVGQHLGGYAWVENLRPAVHPTKTIDNVGTFETQPGTGGYIHTPSMTHAATAAILRSAYISTRNEDPSKFAVDLSSRRVRGAQRVLDEVRAGQPLGAVLGYRFERGLHEGHPEVPGLDLDKIRFRFRNLFPLVAGKNGVDTGELAENIAARNVVDGLALLRKNRLHGIDFANDPELPKPNTSQYLAVKAEIDKIEALHDSVADLMMAEGIYQLASGNVTGAAGPLENLVVGGPPPDPAVARSARTGLGLAHRVALVFPTDRALDIPPGWPAPTPRALAEPTLDAWLARVLGDARNVTCKVTFTESPGSITVKLSDLGLRPLDVLALAQVVLEKGLGSVLDARVLTRALGTDTSKTNVAIEYGPDPARNPKSDRTYPEVLEVARALGAALGGGRPLDASDLLSPSDVDKGGADTEPTTDDVTDIETRADTARSALTEVATSTTVPANRSLARALQVSNPDNPTDSETQNLRAALTVAALFVPERAFPPRTASGKELVALAKAVQKELQKRIDAVTALLHQSATGAKPRVERAVEELGLIFGGGFVAIPTMHVPRPQEIKQSLLARTTLTRGDDAAPSRYLQQVIRVRENLKRFQKFSIYARALRSAPLTLNVVQLPHVPGEQWLGVPFGTTTRPKEGRAGVLLLSEDTAIDPTATWRGVLLEQWTEVIPKKTEQTAIAFHYDTPRAAAPQAVLLAVPPRLDIAWQFEDLLAILNETLDLAKVRAVDAELLPLGQTLPLAIMAQNDAADVTFATFYSAFVGAPDPLAFLGFT